MRILLLLALLAATASAQDARRMDTERVRFVTGESSASAYRSITDGQSHRYLVRVRAGQRLFASLDNQPGLENADHPEDYANLGYAVFQVYAPGRPIQARYAAPSADGTRYDLLEWQGALSRSGDYQIVVYPAPGAPPTAIYNLTIDVEQAVKR